MKLPDFEENSPVQESSSALGAESAAVYDAGNVFHRGLAAFGQEMNRTQHTKASADLLTGLDQAQLDLRTQKTISAADLRKELGPAFDSLPPELKAMTTKMVFNPATQQMEDQDRDDIPMFAVAGQIFDARAKKAVQDSTSSMVGNPHADDFKTDASREVIKQKQQLLMHTMKDAHDFMKEQDTSSAVDLANIGKPEEAKQVLAQSKTMDLAYKAKLQDHIDKITQTRPLYEALRTHNIADMAQQLTQLGDDKQFTKLSPEERDQFTNRLTGEIKDFYRQTKAAGDEELKQNAENGWNTILTKERQGVKPSYNDIPMPGTVHAEAQKEMIKYVDTLNKGEKPETDMTTYAGLTDLASNHKQKFLTTNLLNMRNKLSDVDLKHFLELQTGLKGGNPEKYDNFQNTDEAINAALLAPEYNIDAHDTKDASVRAKVGYVKTLVQHNLAAAQEQNNGKPLGLEDRDSIIAKTLKDNIDPRAEHWYGNGAATVLGNKAGIAPGIAAGFQRAVSSLDSSVMSGSDPDKKVKTLQDRYKDYQALEPYIETAFKIQRGKSVSASDSVQAWYYVRKNWKRLEGSLRAAGQFSDADPDLNNERIVNLGLREALKASGK